MTSFYVLLEVVSIYMKSQGVHEASLGQEAGRGMRSNAVRIWCGFLSSFVAQDESMRHISEGCPGVLYLNLANTTITNRTMRLLPR